MLVSDKIKINYIFVHYFSEIHYTVGGGPTTFLYMATRFLPNVHVQNVQKCTKYVFSCLEVPWIDLLAVANLQ